MDGHVLFITYFELEKFDFMGVGVEKENFNWLRFAIGTTNQC